MSGQVYEDIYDAKNACDNLSGFHVLDRYLIVLYYQPNKQVGQTIRMCVHGWLCVLERRGHSAQTTTPSRHRRGTSVPYRVFS